MTKAEIERLTREQLRALNLDYSFSVGRMTIGESDNWRIEVVCPCPAGFRISVHEQSSVPIPEQIRNRLQSHAATH